MSQPPRLTPREAMERYLDRKRAERTTASTSTHYYRLKLFVEWCEREGIEHLDELDPWDIDRYETHRRGKDLALITLNKELGTLRIWLEYCASRGLCDDDLPEAVDPPSVPQEEKSSDELLLASEANALLTAYRSNPAVNGTRRHAYLELSWYVGCRMGGVRALDVRDYDYGGSYIEFVHRPETGTPLKNKLDGQRVVGLPPEVNEVLVRYIREYREDRADEHGRQPLFTTSQGRPSRSSVRTWAYRATMPCRHSPCPHGYEQDTCDFFNNREEASKCPSSRSPHQIRTGSITWQLNCGLPIEVVAERVNASPETIADHYDKPDPREAMERRRRPYLDRLGFDQNTSTEDTNA